MNFPIIGIAALYLILVLVGQLYFKRAATAMQTDSLQSSVTSLFLNWQMWLAMIVYFAAMLSWVWLLKQIDLSRIFPIMSALLLLTVPLVSAHFLQESLSLRYWLGVTCMLCGILLIATEIKLT